MRALGGAFVLGLPLALSLFPVLPSVLWLTQKLNWKNTP